MMDADLALAKLKEGNKKYVEACSFLGCASFELRKDLTQNGQHPYACVLTCSDSRVVPEAIFGASLGDLFVLRSAGNTISSHELGSLEYAVSHLGVKLFVVLGHSHCGAVDATLKHQGHGHVACIVKEIEEGIHSHSSEEAEKENALFQAKRAKDLYPGDYASIAAYYDIETGEVQFLGKSA